MDVNVEKSGDGEVVTITGELTIQYTQELKTRLLNLLNQTDSLVVNLENIAAIDLTALQLLYAAGQVARLSGKHFVLTTGPAPVLAQAVKEAGFSGHPPFNFNHEQSSPPEPGSVKRKS
jgi:anti-anti-sigma factor